MPPKGSSSSGSVVGFDVSEIKRLPGRFEKMNLLVSELRSTYIRSPKSTCALATRLDNGETTNRSTDRFRWRAPYLTSRPSCNSLSFTVSEHWKTNFVPAEVVTRSWIAC